ncbi:DUF4350 domain-containing protein [Taibaiella lutea]|uniref:DUF4350 domain-containing protein n=1 Tax=Taibaiella lutea TaxID=2608001 RepID=A0A5M6CKV1_9BACT|nr:DUF4350 domain-containing protein [Taibaiella lutea]KAA5535070.1 DUF4350 domain-containing protein [Taibaiella lutea]
MKKKTDWTMDYQNITKNPFSLDLTYRAIPLMFPHAKIETLSPSLRLNNLGYSLRKNSQHSLIFLVGDHLNFNDDEIDSLVSFVEQGNQVLLSSNHFDEVLLDKLALRIYFNESVTDTIQQIYLSKEKHEPEVYNYKSKYYSILQQFENTDTARSYFYTLGTNQFKKSNFIVFGNGKGRLMLHAAPIAFSNYFLLQGNNIDYLKGVFGFVDEPISNIYLISFRSREISTSDFSVLLRNKATATAFWLILFTMGIYLIFEMKRKQKMIPVIKQNENTSVAFTETIGRLYYNNKNHENLAEKMIQHFLEFVRSHYYLNTNMLDAEFVRLLSSKSGIEMAKTDSLIYNIKMVQDRQGVDEAFLFALYTQIQEFYNGK